MSAKVQGRCPMGCGDTLFLGSGGYVTCSYNQCPHPDAVTTILEDRETEHILRVEKGNLTIKHPLRERLNDNLFECHIGWAVDMLATAPNGVQLADGTYRATGNEQTGWKVSPQ